ncbi:polysaccharide pyruvyl transferase family protein [Colwelliaceae bacterium MEBiC 14330]
MKFVVTGPLADKNLGDYAMFINNIYDLGKSYDYSIFHYSGDFVSMLKADYLEDYNCNFTEVKFRQSFYEKPSILNRIVRKLFRSVGIKIAHDSKIPTPFEILNNIDNLSTIESEVINSDALIVSGGGYLNKLWFEWARKDDLFKILAPIYLAKRHNKKIYFTANGYGPFDESEKFFTDFFGFISDAHLGVRDHVLSKTYLKGLGVSDANIINIPDDLFIINEEIIEKANNVSKCPEHNYIVLEFYYSLEWVKENLKTIQSFIDYIWNNYNFKVIYIPFDHTPVAGFLESQITNENFEVYKIGDYLKIEDAITIISNAKAVLCNRYHALVLSLQNQVPVVNIMKEVYDYRYYYNKNLGVLTNIFAEIDFDENLFLKLDPTETLSWFSKNLEAVINQQSDLYKSEKFVKNHIALRKERKDYLNFIQSKSNQFC